MSCRFQVPTLDDLLRHAVDAVRSEGIHIMPTKGGCSEITAAMFELTNPRARVSRSASRGRMFSALGELCWYLSGSNSTEDIAYYIKHYRSCDENGTIFGAYGPRLLSFDGVNQIDYVINALRGNPSSRRTVIQLFDHQDVTRYHKDVPCTCTLQYMLRDDLLTAITYMRSNDVFRGMPHDIFCFTMLQELIARSVGAELGPYHHIVGSLHMYDADIQDLDSFLAEGWQATTRAMPAMPSGEPWRGVAAMLVAERSLRQGIQPRNVDFGAEPYWADLGRMLGVYAVRDGPREAIEQLQAGMDSEFYNSYIADRLDRLPMTGAKLV